MDIGREGAVTDETRTSRTSRTFVVSGAFRTSLWSTVFLCQSVEIVGKRDKNHIFCEKTFDEQG